MEIPEDLAALVSKGGKPLVLGPSQVTQRDRVQVICKVPPGEAPLHPPITLSQKYVNEEDDSGAVINKRLQVDALQLADSDHSLWIGKRDALTGKTAQFMIIDRGQHWELLPVTATYSFTRDLSKFVGRQEAADVERRQRIQRARDQAADLALANRKRSKDDDEQDDEEPDHKRARAPLDSQDVFGTLSVNAEKKLRLKRLLRKRRTEKDLDVGDAAASSIAFGEIRKAEVDWDFEDGGVATDDEELGVMSDHEAVEEDVEDVEDSEEETEDVLTGFGENLTRLLENQREVEADDELAQFSEEEDEDRDSKAGTVKSGPQRPTLPAPPKPADPSAQNEAQIRDNILSLLAASDNRISVKSLLESVGVTAKNSKFHLVKKLISELCDVKTDGATKFFQLKPNIKK